MVYYIPFPYLCIYRLVSFACSGWCVIRILKSIIINFVAICYKIIYILSSSCMNRSLTGIRLTATYPLSSFYSLSLNECASIPSLTTLTHFWAECNSCSPSGDSYGISAGDNEPTECITLVLVGITTKNQLDWVKVAKNEWERGTNTSSLLLLSVRNVLHHQLFFERKNSPCYT